MLAVFFDLSRRLAVPLVMVHSIDPVVGPKRELTTELWGVVTAVLTLFRN